MGKILSFCFRCLILMFSCCRNAEVTCVRWQKSAFKHWIYRIHNWSDKAFKGTELWIGYCYLALRVSWNYDYSPCNPNSPFPSLVPPSPSLPFQPRAEFQSVIKGCYSKKFVDYNVTYVISKYSLQNKSMILFELNLH